MSCFTADICHSVGKLANTCRLTWSGAAPGSCDLGTKGDKFQFRTEPGDGRLLQREPGCQGAWPVMDALPALQPYMQIPCTFSGSTSAVLTSSSASSPATVHPNWYGDAEGPAWAAKGPPWGHPLEGRRGSSISPFQGWRVAYELALCENLSYHGSNWASHLAALPRALGSGSRGNVWDHNQGTAAEDAVLCPTDIRYNAISLISRYESKAILHSQ